MSKSEPRLAPKPFNAPPKGLWRATPPAIFPPVLGLFGIGLAWRSASLNLNAPMFISDMWLGAVSLLYVFAVLTYVAKMVRRPSAVLDDVKILPGRSGLSAATASGFLFAATLVPFAPDLAKGVLAVALAGHAIVALLIIRSMVLGPAEQRRVTPVWHLSFVGFIIAPLAAIPLGWVALSHAIFATTLPIAAAIWLISVLQFAKAGVPAPLRPLLAIHLAPVSLFGIVATMAGHSAIGLAFGYVGITALVIYILAARYLTAGGFTALWGGFTFPLAAIVNLMFTVSLTREQPFLIIGGLGLVLATLSVAYISYRIFKLWSQGKLAKATNASVA